MPTQRFEVLVWDRGDRMRPVLLVADRRDLLRRVSELVAQSGAVRAEVYEGGVHLFDVTLGPGDAGAA